MSDDSGSPLAVLARLASLLEAMGRRYALVGGLAVSVRGEVRFTRDVDVAVAVRDDADAESLVRALLAYGFVTVTTIEQRATGRLATARMRSPGGMAVDLLFASCGIEEEIVAAASPIDLPGVGQLPVASAEHLVAMKVLSSTPERPLDATDLVGILAAGPVDLDVVRGALDRITRAGYHRGQDLPAKLQELVSRSRR